MRLACLRDEVDKGGMMSGARLLWTCEEHGEEKVVGNGKIGLL